MSYIYLGSPYKHQDRGLMHIRYEQVSRAVAHMLQQKINVYSPIAHNHPIAVKYKLPRDFEFWRNFDFAMLEHADVFMILKLDGWQESHGLDEEIKFATKHNIKIEFMDWPL